MKEVTAMRHPLRALGAALFAAALGGSLVGGCGKDVSSDTGPQGSGVNLAAVPPSAYPLPSENDAARFLNQVSFGANDAEMAKARQYGYSAILEDEFYMPGRSHEAYINTISPTSLGDEHVMHTFWREAATGQDQLKRRVAFALSQIFVISLQDANLQNYRRGFASYMDMLERNAFGNYRQLLQDVTLHPMMGLYLSHLRNRKEDPALNRVPDQNYAREVMQLFSIGLYQLNPDGTLVLVSGLPVETYDPDDIVGLSRVFTGFSWAGCPNTSTNCFNGSGTQSPNREVMPMQSFPQFHSISEKTFLGTTIPANATVAQANPNGDLNTALDVIANHPNVGPFIGKQLIQRLVTSNPSPAYVGRVAQAFNTGTYTSGQYVVGTGQRGDLRATVAAVLLDPEARTFPVTDSGKTREPILSLAHWMRAFNARSASGNFLLGTTDDPATSLGQSPMRAPTVFNFYRPGYVPPNTPIATAGLVAPELQNVNEISVVGYSNFMRSQVQNGAGSNSPRDIQPDYTAEMALAHDANLLVDRVSLLLTAGSMSAGTRNLIVTAVNSITMPATNQTNARLNRARLAVFFTLSSPDYLVQK